MSQLPALGLRSRIIVSLAAVLAIFILLTEVSVSGLVRVAMSRQAAISDAGGDAAHHGLARGRTEQELTRLKGSIFIYMITGAALALLIGYIALTILVVRPLNRMTEAVERVAEGRLDTQAPVGGSGELVRLGVALNHMTRTLREQRDELASRLAEIEKSSLDLKTAQDGLVRAAKLASVGTLAAGVAHEIGNPIAGLVGLLDLMDGDLPPEQRASYLTLMRKEIGRIDRIISDLLAYARPSRIEPGTKAVCVVEDVVSHVRSLLSPQRQFDGVDIVTDVRGGPFFAAIPSDDLTQVLVNLFLNAAAAMAGKGRIELRAELVDAWRPALAVVARPAVRLSVADTGPGVPAEHADAVFDPFFSTKGAAKGSGLGLAICQSLCDRAGGEIALDRDHAPGARFVVTLPAT
ncbi:MAG: HAMP domain-containing sensor histidine kinase [Deltaproteobacteria bacterium]|nr:HAMP domain-containing sensor histidine kinase [Deltaproteobacteria bacterium]